MKKLISILLALTLLVFPVYGDDDYTQEQLVAIAKEVCRIEDNYESFKIDSVYHKNDITFYGCRWSSKSPYKEASADIGSDGMVYSYYKYSSDTADKTDFASLSEAEIIADSFLQRVLSDKYSTVKYSSYYNTGDMYSFTYNIYSDGIAYSNLFVNVDVDKYEKSVCSYDYPEELAIANNGTFEGCKSIDEAQSIIKDGIQLGYVTISSYSDGTKTYSTRLIYRLKNYILNAADLSPITSKEEYDYISSSGSSYDTEEASEYSYMLTPEETEGIKELNNAFPADEALNILNSAFNRNETLNTVDIGYTKDYDSFSYFIFSNDDDNYFGCTIDSLGRITSYNINTETDENTVISIDEAEKIAENALQSVNFSYNITDLEYSSEYENNGKYLFKANILRNNYISFAETVRISVSKSGTLSSISINYVPDYAFDTDTNINISKDEFFNIAVNKYGFNPYYSVKPTYSITNQNNPVVPIPMYGFNTKFSVDAETGEVLNYYGKEFEYNGIKEYTDLDNQWYAETAAKLANMGYYFEDEQLKGDEPLTYGALAELNDSGYIGNVDLKNNSEDDTMTRYEFAEYLVDTMYISNVNKYNDIYIKPFDDVDYDHTGTIAILKAMGVVNGSSFNGNETVTRGEAVTMIYRLLTANN